MGEAVRSRPRSRWEEDVVKKKAKKGKAKGRRKASAGKAKKAATAKAGAAQGAMEG